MNGWAKTPSGRVWHQVEYDARRGTAQLMCNFGKVFPVAAADVRDYRATPPAEERCSYNECWAEVQP